MLYQQLKVVKTTPVVTLCGFIRQRIDQLRASGAEHAVCDTLEQEARGVLGTDPGLRGVVGG